MTDYSKMQVKFVAIDDPERQPCTAKVAVRRYGQVIVRPCRTWPAPGEDRCRYHQREA